jgi:tRNA threonylcarbamoyladenosine biosynthesis protein TsaB
MILALKTADATTEAWLFADLNSSEPAAHLKWESGRQLSSEILARLQDFVESHNSKLHALKGLAIFSGPGSFTSLRIGHSVLNALADSLGIPVVGAAGDNWLASAQAALRDARPGRPALPKYGAEAHITKPRS